MMKQKEIPETYGKISPAYDPNEQPPFFLRNPLKISKCSSVFTITAASPPITETPQHHRHRAETSPTQNQGITHISPKHHNAITTHHRDTPETSPTHHLKITRTLLAHAENILTHHQRITETSPRYHRIIHETQTKHNRDITETSPKHHQDITET